MNHQIVSLLESVLGSYKTFKNEEIAFFCPFCAHYKRKLQLNMNTLAWHCWTCDVRGYGIDRLFKKMGETQIKIDKAKELSSSIIKSSTYFTKKQYDSYLSLPEEYIPLWKNTDKIKDSIEYKHAIRYLKKDRKITDIDVLRYRIGYCPGGKFKDMVVIPSFDSNAQLNFYIGRSYYEGSFIRHMKPDNISDDVIGFDLFINWKMPIILTEGVFDAISMRRNTIPLFGKVLKEKLFLKILKEKPQVIVCLDEDAIQEALEIIKQLTAEGIETKLILLKNGDVSKQGFEKVIPQINDSIIMTEKELFKLKLFYGKKKEKNRKKY